MREVFTAGRMFVKERHVETIGDEIYDAPLGESFLSRGLSLVASFSPTLSFLSFFQTKQIKRQQENDESFDMQSSDLMRARCTVPRDPTVLYEGMRRAGLQYGPSFRLLSQVWIPEKTHLESVVR